MGNGFQCMAQKKLNHYIVEWNDSTCKYVVGTRVSKKKKYKFRAECAHLRRFFSQSALTVGLYERGFQVKITVWEQVNVRVCATNLSKFGCALALFCQVDKLIFVFFHFATYLLHITTCSWCFHVISSCEFRLHSGHDRQSNGMYCFWFTLLQTGLLTTFRPWQWYESTPQSQFRWTTSHVNI